MTQDYIDVKMSLPYQMFVMINEVARHGVFHMLIPPVDTIKRWIDRDADASPKIQHFKSEAEEEAFLQYMDSLIPPSLISYLENDNKTDEITIEENGTHEEMDKASDSEHWENLKDLQSAISSFSQHLQDKVVEYLLLLYLDISECLDDGGDDDIPPSVQSRVDDVLFDLLISVKMDLESEQVKSVLSQLNAGDSWYVAWHNILDDMMKRHHYESHAVLDAKERLHVVFKRTLKPIMSGVKDALNDGIIETFQNLLEEDRRNIPGPQCLE